MYVCCEHLGMSYLFPRAAAPLGTARSLAQSVVSVCPNGWELPCQKGAISRACCRCSWSDSRNLAVCVHTVWPLVRL
jgi:hypothetical protein